MQQAFIDKFSGSVKGMLPGESGFEFSPRRAFCHIAVSEGIRIRKKAGGIRRTSFGTPLPFRAGNISQISLRPGRENQNSDRPSTSNLV